MSELAGTPEYILSHDADQFSQDVANFTMNGNDIDIQSCLSFYINPVFPNMIQRNPITLNRGDMNHLE